MEQLLEEYIAKLDAIKQLISMRSNKDDTLRRLNSERWIIQSLVIDIEHAIADNTTDLTSIEDLGCTIQATACCGIAPITNENFCPNCGKRIVK